MTKPAQNVASPADLLERRRPLGPWWLMTLVIHRSRTAGRGVTVEAFGRLLPDEGPRRDHQLNRIFLASLGITAVHDDTFWGRARQQSVIEPIPRPVDPDVVDGQMVSTGTSQMSV